MELLQQLLENSGFPIVTAFVLGLMTAISPCPMATNITAIGFISRDINNKTKVLINGFVYTLGRAITYTSIGLIFYFGADQFQISSFVQLWGEKLLGPLLIIIGIFMLGIIKINIPGLSNFNDSLENKAKKGYWGVLLLGIVFALAFCPYSGVLYFGMLIPITISSVKGLYLPLVFAIATGIPALLFAWLLAYSVGSVSKIYNRVKVFELWFRRIVAVLFIVVGIFYILSTQGFI